MTTVSDVGSSVVVTEPVLPMEPASILACVTVWVPVSTHVPPGATVAQVVEAGVNRTSLTSTLFWVTVPSLVIVTL